VAHALTSQAKLYIADIKETLNPVLDSGATHPHHNLYFIQSDYWDLEVLGGLLLSAVGQFFVECYGVRMRGGHLRFQAQYLRRIRVPEPCSLTEIQSGRLREAFRARDRQNATCAAFRCNAPAIGRQHRSAEPVRSPFGSLPELLSNANAAPLPGSSDADNYVGASLNPQSDGRWTGRFDQNWSSNQITHFTITLDQFENLTPSWLSPLQQGTVASGNSYAASLNHVWTITPTTILEIRGGVGWSECLR
jgi:hypothetical protein